MGDGGAKASVGRRSPQHKGEALAVQSQERIQVNITVPKWLKDAMDGLYFARWKTDGSETHKCKFYVEALTPYVSSMDPNTGYPKRPASTSEVRMEGVAAETAIVLPSNLQHFSALVNCNQYEDDDSICLLPPPE